MKFNISETDRFLLETKCNILKRKSKCPDGFSWVLKRKNESYIYVSLKCVTMDGEVFQRDIYLAHLLKMNERALRLYAESYFN